MDNYNFNRGLEYNTERTKLSMPEYGRNVLKMVEALHSIESRSKRSKQAAAIVKVMELLNPQVHVQEDYEHKLWDQLYMIAGFDLDIDSPYPCPAKEEFSKSPVPLPMKDTRIKATHYGRNIEKIIDLLCNEPDGEIKTEMIRSLGIYMRQQYLIWNKDNVADETIFSDIERISDFRLKVPDGLSLGKLSSDINYARPTLGIKTSSANTQPKKRQYTKVNRKTVKKK